MHHFSYDERGEGFIGALSILFIFAVGVFIGMVVYNGMMGAVPTSSMSTAGANATVESTEAVDAFLYWGLLAVVGLVVAYLYRWR